MPSDESHILKAGIDWTPLLVVAALELELAPLRRRMMQDLTLLVTGEGPDNARRALAASLEQTRQPAVIAIGFAGALSPQLRVGDLVVVTAIGGSHALAPSPRFLSAAQGLAERDSSIHFGAAVTTPDVICSADEKRQLATEMSAWSPLCVDMESAGFVAACSETGIPLLIVRSISDLYDEDLPVDFNRCRGEDGRISRLRVIREVALKPSAVRPLIELGNRSRLCAERLADFVEKLVR
jgi:adenosylhomocysteine nucleosidase